MPAWICHHDVMGNNEFYWSGLTQDHNFNPLTARFSAKFKPTYNNHFIKSPFN